MRDRARDHERHVQRDNTSRLVPTAKGEPQVWLRTKANSIIPAAIRYDRYAPLLDWLSSCQVQPD